MKLFLAMSESCDEDYLIIRAETFEAAIKIAGSIYTEVIELIPEGDAGILWEKHIINYGADE